ncbi:MAG: ScpA family protein [Anaerolineae bacterium]|nr:ScpA family protein [Anaerolineae bacterium]
MSDAEQHALEETNNAYMVELPDFEGPLDLLLNLIEKEELDITKVALARVTDQFLAYINILKSINPDELTDFLVVAAKLILIKSEVLLPRPPPGIIEEEEEDLGDELARQLLIYKQFKQIAAHLRELEEKGQRNFIRLTHSPPKVEPKLVEGDVSVGQLLQAAIDALSIKAPDPDVDDVVSRVVVTIGRQMSHIRQILLAAHEVSFQRLLTAQRTRVEVIVTLLAVLELIKRRVIKVEQPDQFGDILIRHNDAAPALSDTEWEELEGLTEVS